jgi:hypothetical protein
MYEYPAPVTWAGWVWGVGVEGGRLATVLAVSQKGQPSRQTYCRNKMTAQWKSA